MLIFVTYYKLTTYTCCNCGAASYIIVCYVLYNRYKQCFMGWLSDPSQYAIYKAPTILYGCNSRVDCVTVFALSLFASTLDQQLRRPQTDKQIELSLFMHLPRFLYVSVSVGWRLPDPEQPIYGEVRSPQYPQPYPPNLQEQWDLSVPEGYQIRLTFTHLDIEASEGCHYDALTVRPTFQHISFHKKT